MELLDRLLKVVDEYLEEHPNYTDDELERDFKVLLYTYVESDPQKELELLLKFLK